MTAKGAGRRVPRAGGAIDEAALAPDGGFADLLDHRHAYFDEEHAYELSQATVTSFDYVFLGGDSIGVRANNGASTSVAKSFGTSDRKALVMDKKHIVWLEPALHAVVAADDYGTKLRYVVDAWTPAGADLALANDRVFLLDVAAGSCRRSSMAAMRV